MIEIAKASILLLIEWSQVRVLLGEPAFSGAYGRFRKTRLIRAPASIDRAAIVGSSFMLKTTGRAPGSRSRWRNNPAERYAGLRIEEGGKASGAIWRIDDFDAGFCPEESPTP